jgi:hypothetical protein
MSRRKGSYVFVVPEWLHFLVTLETRFADGLVFAIVAMFVEAFVCDWTANAKSPTSEYAAARVARQFASNHAVSSHAFVADSIALLPSRCCSTGQVAQIHVRKMYASVPSGWIRMASV